MHSIKSCDILETVCFKTLTVSMNGLEAPSRSATTMPCSGGLRFSLTAQFFQAHHNVLFHFILHSLLLIALIMVFGTELLRRLGSEVACGIVHEKRVADCRVAVTTNGAVRRPEGHRHCNTSLKSLLLLCSERRAGAQGPAKRADPNLITATMTEDPCRKIRNDTTLVEQHTHAVHIGTPHSRTQSFLWCAATSTKIVVEVEEEKL